MKRAIESVLNQTYKDIECVVVDDASDESSEGLCNQYAVRYIYIPQEESRGGNYARNLGIKETDGKFVAFLDDDDYWLPTKIEKQVALISSKSGCGMVYCKRFFERVYNDDNIVVREQSSRVSCPQGNLHEEILWGTVAVSSCILCTRSLLLEIGMFDDRLSSWQDYDLTIRAAQKSDIYMVEEPLVVYRKDVRAKGRISNDYGLWLSSARRVHNKYKQLYSELDIDKKVQAWAYFHRSGMVRSKRSGLKLRYLWHTAVYYMLISILKILNKNRALSSLNL